MMKKKVKSIELLKVENDIVQLMLEWMRRYEDIIIKIDNFFKTKYNQFENEFKNLTNVLLEKIENVSFSL